jgi:hypothetical protein
VAEHDTDSSIINNSGELMMFGQSSDVVVEPQVISQPSDAAGDPLYLQELNAEQRMAHDIVINHLDAEMANRLG